MSIVNVNRKIFSADTIAELFQSSQRRTTVVHRKKIGEKQVTLDVDGKQPEWLDVGWQWIPQWWCSDWKWASTNSVLLAGKVAQTAGVAMMIEVGGDRAGQERELAYSDMIAQKRHYRAVRETPWQQPWSQPAVVAAASG